MVCEGLRMALRQAENSNSQLHQKASRGTQKQKAFTYFTPHLKPCEKPICVFARTYNARMMERNETLVGEKRLL